MENFEAWLRRQDADVLDEDILIYGTPVMTAVMVRSISLCPRLGGGKTVETVIISAYPEAKLVTVTYPRIDVAGGKGYPGVVREVPVRSATEDNPSPLGERFSAEVKRHIGEGWAAISEAER